MFGLTGMPVYIDDLLGWKQERVQVKFPRSKKRRVRNKWSRQDKNFHVRRWQVPEAYQIGHMIVMNSAAKSQMKTG